MIFLPYRTETVINRWPIGNIIIISACTLTFVLLLAGFIPLPLIHAMVLHGWNPIGFLGHQFLHAGFGHLFFNMLFLWVFGNAVCETMGNGRYVTAFLIAGVFAGIIHNIFDGAPAVGASGAINGIVGFYLVLYPVNTVDCFYWIFFRFGTVEVTGYWLVLLWFLGDAWGAFFGSGEGVAYWAHLGGLAAGIALGVLFEIRGWAKLAEYDNPSLIDLLFRKREEPKTTRQFKTREELIKEHEAQEIVQTQPNEAEDDASGRLAAECPHCHTALELSADMVGQTLACPSCNGEIRIEAV
jgi:membrane associated rhomboid family serine protease